MFDLQHRIEVCRLYRRAVRLMGDWLLNRNMMRNYVLAIRKQFDLNRTETDPTKIELQMNAARYLLWKFRHPEPYVCNLHFSECLH